MYNKFFHLNVRPFENTPNPDFFYPSGQHREALAALLYGVREGKGFMSLIGDVGSGKTLIIQALQRELGDNCILLEISTPWISPDEIFSEILRKTGIVADEKADLLVLQDRLRKRLEELDREGTRVVLIMDEGQQIPERTLEGIRLLSNIETPERKLIQIILSGQTELEAVLARHSMRQIRQRMVINCKLTHLNEVELTEYVHHRLRVAGGSPDIFAPEAMEPIYRASKGIPRVINQICDNALITGFADGVSVIGPNIITDVVGDLLASHDDAGAVTPVITTAPKVEEKVQAGNNIDTASAAGAESAAVKLSAAERTKMVPVSTVAAAVVIVLLIGAVLFWTFGGESGTEDMAAGQSEMVSPIGTNNLGASATALADQRRRQSSSLVPAFGNSGTEDKVAAPQFDSRDVKAQAMKKYQAWNSTIEDLLLFANPAITSFDSLPEGTEVRLPDYTQEDMLVQANPSSWYVFYGTFDSLATAEEAVRLLESVGEKPRVDTMARHDATVYRIYLGTYPGKEEALRAAKGVWFQHMPFLNLGSRS